MHQNHESDPSVKQLQPDPGSRKSRAYWTNLLAIMVLTYSTELCVILIVRPRNNTPNKHMNTMKRPLAVLTVLSLSIAFLTGCSTTQRLTSKAQSQAPKVKTSSSVRTEAKLTGLQVTFHVTDDDKDGGTSVDLNVNNGSIQMGAANVGGGEHWDDHSGPHDRIVPIVNAVTFDQGAHGNCVITIRPSGDDEWHFNGELLMNYEFGGWRKVTWTGANVAEDRPTVTISW